VEEWEVQGARTGVGVETLTLKVDGDDVPTVLCRPAGSAATAGVVIATEAQGVNNFIKGVGVALAQQGYLAIIPDYYHGTGPEDPEALCDVAHMGPLLEAINSLDFRRGAEDMLAADAYLREHEHISSVAVWGYCTGGTLSWLAAALGRDIDAAVLFYPSQPTFHELSPAQPQHPIDMIWQIRCPVLLLVGDEDQVWPPDLVDEVTRRFSTWSIPLSTEIYRGAGHTFAGHFEDWHRPDAAADSMQRALAFLAAQLPDNERIHR
jgi:carboxymethylenebutenolidase